MIYNITGNEPLKAYSCYGNECINGYNKNGNHVYISKNEYIQGRTIVFEDDFEGDALDENIWDYDLRELRGYDKQHYKKDNVSVNNSCLIITARKENEWTSGRINTAGKNGWKCGRFEAKIKFPGIPGAFPAFWLMGLNMKSPQNPYEDSLTKRKYKGSVEWPICGELDIVEIIPGESKRPVSTVWPAKEYIEPYNYLYQTSPTYDIDSSDWHVYAVEITTEYITFYIDGIQIGAKMKLSDYTYNEIAAFNKPLHIILNLAIESDREPSANKMEMYVDWVRVYAPEGVSTDIQETAILLPENLTIEPESDEYVPFAYFIYPEFLPENVTDRSIRWYTTDETIISCDSGVITAHANGSAKIVAVSKNGKVAIMNVTVTGMT